MIAYPPGYRFPDPVVTPFHDTSCGLAINSLATVPTSGAWTTAGRAFLYPLRLNEAMTVAKAYILKGATVGTDSWDIGVYRMTDVSTGRVDLIRSTGVVLSSAGANVCQETATWKVARSNRTSGGSSVDGDSYATASVTLKTGRLYCLAIEHSHATDAPVVASIEGGPTFTSRASVQFNGTANRVSLWTAVPTADYTGTLTITFAASSGVTGATWSLDEMSGVDTSTNDGIVQTATGAGSSVTPLATLAAFASTSNATYGIHGKAANATSTPGTGFTELSDTGTATPAQSISTEWRVDNGTTVDFTITSTAWGAIAAEIKADTSPFVVPPQLPGSGDLYLSVSNSGTTATYFSINAFQSQLAALGALCIQSGASPLPSTATATSIPVATQRGVIVCGLSARSLLA